MNYSHAFLPLMSILGGWLAGTGAAAVVVEADHSPARLRSSFLEG